MKKNCLMHITTSALLMLSYTQIFGFGSSDVKVRNCSGEHMMYAWGKPGLTLEEQKDLKYRYLRPTCIHPQQAGNPSQACAELNDKRKENGLYLLFFIQNKTNPIEGGITLDSKDNLIEIDFDQQTQKPKILKSNFDPKKKGDAPCTRFN